MMEEVYERLKLLNYEKDFLLKNQALKPLNRAYFAISLNASEQFNYFKLIIKIPNGFVLFLI